ncbi:glycosyltransferase family 4 protein [Aliifodinibius sp. S!AR15-10]|uniref:glycosyltransferase family 4 protein n=1 Tax=Aliifodinibius sp. S!AR15-10 TaxID=2950437 RepID=UPI0028584A7A|nr:glycosyltransferase family 4 protein [Aliifodinibius sp. S!AR15-10]MDR8393194.1 glycosyltransferase family 4 protein [Aliifodinibius sp. S!AR15-10]
MENVGGMQRVSLHLINELEKMQGVSVHQETINVSGKGWIGLSTFSFLLRNLFSLPALAKRVNADVILFSSMVTASLAVFIRNRVSVPMVTINHGRDVTLPNPLYQNFVPRIFASLDGVISVSSATREECIKRGMDPTKGVALGNGFNMERLNNFPDKLKSKNDLQEEFGIDLENKFLLLSVGRQVKRKGHEWFIRNVFPKLRKDLVFVVIGDGPEKENIRRAAKEIEGGDRIFLLGRQPDEILNKTYAAADLFMMPNIPVEGDMEGFGIVLLEANMARTPAVAADLEGIKDVITDGENGYRLPTMDDQAFADKINTILENGLTEFAEHTRSFVLEQFSWNNVAKKYIEYMRTVIDKYST